VRSERQAVLDERASGAKGNDKLLVDETLIGNTNGATRHPQLGSKVAP
jgi:hypothetical protein